MGILKKETANHLLLETGDWLVLEGAGTPTFAIDGGSNIPGVMSSWHRVPKRKNVDGTINYMPYAINVWDIPQAEMSNFETWQGLAGTTLTSLDTTDIDDRNNAAQYTSVELSVVNCEQIGRRATGIRLEFKVDVS